MKRHLSSRGTRKTAVIAAVFAMAASTCAVAAGATGGGGPAGAAADGSVAPAHAPDIVLILTDDQRFDTLWSMPTVESELVAKGIEFSNGYVSNPVCCPSRSSILTGEYSHSTGVYTNHPSQPYGGFPAFHDRSTVATWLSDAGYRTALMGKYLNGYTGTYVPPGWDQWFVTWDGGGYYDYSANSNGVVTSFGSASTAYSTDVLADHATDFITSTKPTQPLFLYFAPHAPHAPATPAHRDAHAFSDLGSWRPASYNEADVSDKPSYIRAERPLTGSVASSVDRFRLDQYRSLRATDRAVASILDALTVSGRLSNTMIVFMSDNGMLWGEHRWHNKLVPYEESIKVPFVIRDDALIASSRRDKRLVLNIDLAPTFAQLAGVDAPNVEGRSLLPLLASTRGSWRADFLMEHMRMDPGGVPTYCGVHTQTAVYVDYVTGEEELYDLARDPYEMQNVVRSARYAKVLLAMRRRLKQLCDPVPRGSRSATDTSSGFGSLGRHAAGSWPRRTNARRRWSATSTTELSSSWSPSRVEAASDRDARRSRPGEGQGHAGRPPGRDAGCARDPPRPGARDLPAAPGRSGARRGADVAGAQAAVPVDVETDGVGRYPQEVEAAVYFCCLEALQNVAKYANASRATIVLSADERVLRFEVRDDGAGFDSGATSYGSGLQGMADRLDAIRGTLEVRSVPGEGTTIVGTVASIPRARVGS